MKIETTESGLSIITHRPTKSRDEQIREEVRDEHQRQVRVAIERGLWLIQELMGEFEQTCHGRLGFGSDAIQSVTDSLAKCYREPTAFNISEAIQCIRLLLKQGDGRLL